MASRKVARRIGESVSGRSMVTLTVSPATANVADGATEQYTVAGVDTYGNVVPIAAADIAWSVSHVNAGTISATGLLTAGTVAGTYQVRATHSRTGVYDEADAVLS